MITAGPMRAVGYVRVSTEDQAKEGFSLDAQRARVAGYCAARGWNLIRVFVDEGISAYHDVRRPEYEAMLASRESWDVLVVVKMDRIWRNAARFMEMTATLRAEGKEFASIDESLDTTSVMGRFVQDILARIAQLESERTAERVLYGMSQKFASAVDAWQTRPPLGYAVKDGHLTLVEDEARVVREAFRLAAEGATVERICIALNAAGFHGKSGGKFAPTTVLHILRNPVYARYVYWDGMLRRNGHDAVVSDDVFNAAQIALYARTRSVGRNKWPLIVGAAGMTVERMGSVKETRGRAAYYYVTSTRPDKLDALIASFQREQLARRRVRSRPSA